MDWPELSEEEIGETLDISKRTVIRGWNTAPLAWSRAQQAGWEGSRTGRLTGKRKRRAEGGSCAAYIKDTSVFVTLETVEGQEVSGHSGSQYGWPGNCLQLAWDCFCQHTRVASACSFCVGSLCYAVCSDHEHLIS